MEKNLSPGLTGSCPQAQTTTNPGPEIYLPTQKGCIVSKFERQQGVGQGVG